MEKYRVQTNIHHSRWYVVGIFLFLFVMWIHLDRHSILHLASKFSLWRCPRLWTQLRKNNEQYDEVHCPLECISLQFKINKSRWARFTSKDYTCRWVHTDTNCEVPIILESLTYVSSSAVNMPMLFGPLALVGYISLFEHIRGIIAGRRGKGKTYSTSCSFTETICKWSILSGLIVLSCAPHQEPRFLLPSIVPLAFLHGRQVVGSGDYGVAFPKRALSSSGLWIMFNLILYIFFGWLHQGGLLHSLLHLNDSKGHYTIKSAWLSSA